MLGSDSDGEVVATVRAIGRTLTAAASDWHALAASVEMVPAIGSRMWVPPQPKPFDPNEPPRWNDLCRTESVAWLDLLATASWATPWERSLAGTLKDQMWGQPHRQFTPRQKGVLTGLIAKAMQRGERP